MNIVAIEVAGFGALRERHLALGGGLTLLYGPNEAGKSTLMGFIRAVLFGFPSRANKAERYEPAGGVYGGALVLLDERGRRFRVERYDGAASGAGGPRRPSAGMVKVTLEDGSTGGEELLRVLLGGLSAELFRSLFAFGLGELQELGTLQAEELSGYIYSAGLGVSGTTIREAERKLAAQTDSLYKPRGRNQEIAGLLRELEETERLLRHSRQQSAAYDSLQAERRGLERRIAAIREQQRTAQSELDKLELAARARSTWVRFKGASRELDELPELPGFPDEALVRLMQLEDELERAESACAALELRRRGLEESLERLGRPASVALEFGGVGSGSAAAGVPLPPEFAPEGGRDDRGQEQPGGPRESWLEDVPESEAMRLSDAQADGRTSGAVPLRSESQAEGKNPADLKQIRFDGAAPLGSESQVEGDGEVSGTAMIRLASGEADGHARAVGETWLLSGSRTNEPDEAAVSGLAQEGFLAGAAEPAGSAVGDPRRERELEQLLDEASVYADKRRELLETQAELAQMKLLTERLLEQIDASWTEETLVAFPVSIALREEIRSFKLGFAELHEEEQRHNAEREHLRLQAARLDDSVRTLELELARLTAAEAVGAGGSEAGGMGGSVAGGGRAVDAGGHAAGGVYGGAAEAADAEGSKAGGIGGSVAGVGRAVDAGGYAAGGAYGGAAEVSHAADALQRALHSAEAAGQRADEVAGLVRQLTREHARWRLLSKDAEHARERAAERQRQQAQWAEAEALGRRTAASRRLRLALLTALAGLLLAAWLLWQGAAPAAAIAGAMMIGIAIILGAPGAGEARRARRSGVRSAGTPEPPPAPGTRAAKAAARASGAPWAAAPAGAPPGASPLAGGEADWAAREADAASRLEAQLAELERSLQIKLERLLGGRAEVAAALGGASAGHREPIAGSSAGVAQRDPFVASSASATHRDPSVGSPASALHCESSAASPASATHRDPSVGSPASALHRESSAGSSASEEHRDPSAGLPAALLAELDSLLERLQLEVEHGRERRAELRAKRDKLREALAAREAHRAQEAQLVAAACLRQQAAAEQLAGWQAWLGERLLSPSLSPDAALETAQAVERAQEQLRQQRRLEARRARLSGDIQRYEAAAAAWLGEAALREPVAALRRWKERWQEEERREEERRGLQQRLVELEQERELAAAFAARVRKRLDSLLREASAESGEQLRHLHRQQEQRSKLMEERKLLAEALESLVGATALSGLAELLENSGEDELEGRRRQLEQQLQQAAEEEGALREQAGRLLGEVEKLEQGRELADRLLQAETQRAALSGLVGKYAVAAFAAALIRKAQGVYERERQPGVLQRASGYFSAMTEGRFVQVKAPFAQQRLVAVRAGAEAVETEKLSRGTAEQLYLAMRLALAEEYAGKAVLPLVLDDILVNFDDRRMESCLRVLSDFSARHQVLLFTCHAHVRDAVRRLCPGQSIIEL